MLIIILTLFKEHTTDVQTEKIRKTVGNNPIKSSRTNKTTEDKKHTEETLQLAELNVAQLKPRKALLKRYVLGKD